MISELIAQRDALEEETRILWARREALTKQILSSVTNDKLEWFLACWSESITRYIKDTHYTPKARHVDPRYNWGSGIYLQSSITFPSGWDNQERQWIQIPEVGQFGIFYVETLENSTHPYIYQIIVRSDGEAVAKWFKTLSNYRSLDYLSDHHIQMCKFIAGLYE